MKRSIVCMVIVGLLATPAFGEEITRPKSDPWLAAGLSAAFPGAGQIYQGDTSTATWHMGAAVGLTALGALGLYVVKEKTLAWGSTGGLVLLSIASAWDAFGKDSTQ